MPSDTVTKLLLRSNDFQQKILSIFSNPTLIPDERFLISFQSGFLSLQHGVASVQLISIGLIPSGFCLFRPQFECLTRGIWLLHAASEKWVDILSEDLNEVSSKKSNKMPMIATMIDELKVSTAPDHLVAQLIEFKDITLSALNSYTHGGLHPISRIASGYPEKLIYDTIRNSNAISALSAQLLSITTNDPQSMDKVRKLHESHKDCIPIIQ